MQKRFNVPSPARLFLTIITAFLLFHVCNGKPSCASPIYCHGDLLHVVQTSKIFNDSKTFVDMAMINPVNQTLDNFQIMMAETNNQPTREQIQDFVGKNFKSIGELVDHLPRDFKSEPKIIKDLNDPVVIKFVQAVNSIWPTLTRKIAYHVFEHPERHSLIPVTEPFVVPGGRFREYYYWDTYWILKGLLLSDMLETARGMTQNLLSIVERYGYIPNGGRVYYLTRSQPPMLTLIVSDYVHVSKDFEFLRQNIKTLEKELQFWLERRTTIVEKDGQRAKLAHYDSDSDSPRPESYLEDIETCSVHGSDEDKFECYTDIKGGAESGLDFTCRWMYDNHDKPTGDLSQIKTRRTIPVDLNAILYKCFMSMYKFCVILRQDEDAKRWLDLADQWKIGIENILWHEDDGTWYDLDNKLGKPRKYFYASNVTPLWAGAFPEDQRQNRGKRTLQYLLKHGIHTFKAGVPLSLENTGQQWDYPNAWTPYQNLVIIGLEKSGYPEAQEFARELAYKWVNTLIKAYHENKVLFEKYNAVQSGSFGGGGEYLIQAGFGWTNGGVLELIHLYFRTRKRKYTGHF